jgi:hypothetical protein
MIFTGNQIQSFKEKLAMNSSWKKIYLPTGQMQTKNIGGNVYNKTKIN